MTSSPPASRVLVVDDDPDFREILLKWLAASGYEVAVAADGFEAISQAKQTRPDIVITDLRMPLMSGLQLLSIFKEMDATIQVLILSGQGTMDDAIAALREGRAYDYLQKPVRDLRNLNLAIEKALAHRRALQLPPAGGTAAPRGASGTGGDRASLLSPGDGLTTREREILRFIAEGMENKEISSQLHLSEKTVRNHLSRIYEKLGVSNRTQAAMLCKERGLID